MVSPAAAAKRTLTPRAALRGPALFLALTALASCGPAAPAAQPPPPPAALAAPPAHPPAVDDDPAAAARIAADVTYLASPALAGRGTGEEGARLAADFITKRFEDLHLAPYGARDKGAPPSYLQAFQARVGAKVDEASLDVEHGPAARKPAHGEVAAADGAANGAAAGKGVFVGYGITAAAVGWDDYAGADPRGEDRRDPRRRARRAEEARGRRGPRG